MERELEQLQRNWRGLKAIRRIARSLLQLFRETAIAMKEEGHAAGDGTGNAQFVETTSDVDEGPMESARLLEVHASLVEGPQNILIQTLFVGDHGYLIS